MGAKNNEGTKMTFWKMDARTQDGRTPIFVKVEKVDGSWRDTEKFNTLFGTVVDIEHKQYEFEGEMKHQAIIVLADKDGLRDKVQCGFNQCTYNLLNSLAGSDLSAEMEMTIATKTDKDTGKVWPAIYVEFGGQKSTWKYDPKELPKSEKVKVGSKEYTDDTKVVEFFINVIAEIKPQLEVNAVFAKPNEDLAAHGMNTSGDLDVNPDHTNADSDDLSF